MVCPVKINSGCLIFPVLLGFVLNSSRTQGRIPSPLFFEFSGSVYCSIFNSQGSVLLSFSATACLVYHAVFDLSTTFFKFFKLFSTRFELACRCFSGVSHILPPLSTNVNSFFHFFQKYCNSSALRRFRQKKALKNTWTQCFSPLRLSLQYHPSSFFYLS